MAVQKDGEGSLEAACALGCSCMLSCGFMFGLFFTISGGVLYYLDCQYPGERFYVIYDVIDLETFSLVVLCVGAVLTFLTVSSIVCIKCCQFYIRHNVQQQLDNKTPLVSKSYNYHYSTYPQEQQSSPPPTYSRNYFQP